MQSSGRSCETLFEHWSNNRGWFAIRLQPETRIVKIGGKLMTIQARSKGQPDFIVEDFEQHQGRNFHVIKYVECKEAAGNSMPCNRLGSLYKYGTQNWFMDHRDHSCCFVFILWDDNLHECFPWQARGSYKKGAGFR